MTTKAEALKLLDNRKDFPMKTADAIKLAWLRAMINCIPDSSWEDYVAAAAVKLARGE